MAKKGQAVQLQAEINTDEEWERLLHREGLIVVDVYSNWCGPCLGMSANLKKLKLEIGGDMLHLAMAKSDNIQALERFRNKSEPTWMFISKGKMVNFMFGANSPKLTRLIIDELKKETAAVEGTRERSGWNITEMADEERERYDVQETLTRAAVEKEEAKRTKEIFERRTAECENIITNLPNFGTVLIFPHAVTKYKEILVDVIEEAGLLIQQTEKIKTITEEMVEEILFFANYFFPQKSIDELGQKQSLALLMRRTSDSLPNALDEIVLQMVYGNSRTPPGSDKSPSLKLMKKSNEDEDEDVMLGIWAPPNALTKAAVLKVLFPNISTPFRLSLAPLLPLHVAVAYDAFKGRDVLELSSQYPGQVLAYGYFTTDIPVAAKLIAKTLDKFEAKTESTTFEEKIVVQLSKTDLDCVMTFAELGPSYMSTDAIRGEEDCKYFFPQGYNEPEAEVVEIKRKSKKKGKGKMPTPTSALEGDVQQTEGDVSIEAAAETEHEEAETLIGEEELDEDEEGDEVVLMDEEETLIGADKATSPLNG